MVFCFSAAGLAFRISSGASLTQCIFSHPECSTAVATWLLGVVTSAAFLAAYEAATKAGQALRVSRDALQLEVNAVLGLTMCTNDDHKRPRKALFLSGGRAFDSVPDGSILDDFVALDFDFENLGRTALLNLAVSLKVNDDVHRVQIGNIGADKDAHISVMLLWEQPSLPILEWLSPAVVSGKDLDFAPLPPGQVQGPVTGSEQSELAKADRRWVFKFITPTGTKKSSPPDRKGTQAADGHS